MKKLFIFILIIFLYSACSKNSSPAEQPAPTITGFSPAKDSAGAQVTITGTNFSVIAADNIVKFNGVAATVITATATQLVVIIPPGVTSGNITVSVSGNTATSVASFTAVSAGQLLIVGKWTYASSFKSDTVFYSGYPPDVRSFTNTNLDPTTNYLQFTDSSTAYYFQQAWGPGLSGVLYRDTVNYTIKDNYIFLSYPAGTNNYSGGFSYPAYQDTITIKTLTGGSFIMSRYYHYKHYTFDSNEVKLSIDSLTR